MTGLRKRMLEELQRRNYAALRIPAKLNADSGHRDHGFRASRSLIGAKRREQLLVVSLQFA